MKYQLHCVDCHHTINNLSEWFKNDQKCPKCNSKHAEVSYTTDYKKLDEILKKDDVKSFWEYFDFLPLENKENIISLSEGAIPLERWGFLEDYATDKYNVKCTVYIYRNDLNGGTKTFKDVAGSLAASVLKEHNVKEYCAASTGNTALAFSKYLSKVGVKFHVFLPETADEDLYQEILLYGQDGVKVDGNYGYAKKLAAEFHDKNKVMISGGNIDPIRVEAKKTMAFEFLRQINRIPDVYIQAVSGGTGPIALEKGVRELQQNNYDVKLPKMILVQQDLCDPMVKSWEKAKENNFPEGFEKDYISIENPETKVNILSTGTPGTYPIVSKIVKDSGGEFIRVAESSLVDYAKIIKKEKNLEFGPASIVCFEGFYKALHQNLIKDGDVVLVNLGEGVAKAKDFAKKINN